MDSVIGIDFKNEMPIVITKTIAATVVKGVAAYAANQAAGQQNDWRGCSCKSAPPFIRPPSTSPTSAPGRRCPSNFKSAIFPRRRIEKLNWKRPAEVKESKMTIGDGTINLIYVKSINATSPLLVTQMKLK